MPSEDVISASRTPPVPRWMLWVLDQTNLIVTGLTACTVLYTRSAAVLYFSCGAVMCSLTVKVIKRFVRQERPVATLGKRKKTYGMPSTHSASITYFATYIALASAFLPTHPSLDFRVVPARVLAPLLFTPIAATIVVSRIWLGHHTWPQVAFGTLYGAIFAPIWFRLWTHGGLNVYGPLVEEMAGRYL